MKMTPNAMVMIATSNSVMRNRDCQIIMPSEKSSNGLGMDYGRVELKRTSF